MPGIIGTNKTRQKQIFRQLSDKPVNAGDYRFFPWAAPPTKTRDSAPPQPRGITRDALERIVPIMADIGARIDRLEQKRAAQRQLAEQMALQPRPAQVQFEQPTHQTQDHAPPCSCQQPKPTPRVYRDGVTTMVDRHPGLAPNWHIRSGCFPRYDKPAHTTRDQTYGETPSRFTSESADKMARHIVGAGPPSQKELNDSYVAHWARDDGAAPLGAPGVNKRGGMTEARSNDPSEAFASELNAIPSGQPQAALNCFNRAYHGAKTSDARDKIERVFRDWQSSYDARGDNPWKPRQAAHDAPWSNLYSQNASVIGSDPNKISPGMKLDVGGGQSHTVAAGETLSGIAQQYSGGAGGIHPLASEGGGASPTGGNYSSGGDLKSGEGNPLQGMGPGGGGPKTLLGGGGTTSSSSGSGSGSGNVPTPPVKPSEYGGAGGNNETGMGGAGKGPTTLLGGGGEASGGNYSSNASLKTGEGWPSGSSSAYPTGGAPSGGAGEGLKPLASEGGSGGTTSDAKKPRGRK